MKILEQPEFFHQLFQSIPDAAVILDHTDRVIQVNQEFARFFGYEQEAVVGREINGLVVPPQLLDEGKRLSRIALEGTPVQNESIRCSSDGTPRPVAISSSPIYLGGQQVAIFVMYRDIADLKQAITERDILLDTIETHLWYLTDPGTYGAVNAAHAGYHGMTPQQMSNHPAQDFFPDLADTIREWNRPVFETGKPETVRHWIRGRDGVNRFFRIHKIPRLDTQGRVETVVCSGEDITEQWERENELRLLSYMVEHSADPMLRMDASYRIAYVNAAFERQLGWSQQELLGKHPSFLNAEENSSEIQEDIMAVLKDGFTWSGRVRNRRKDGSTFIAALSITPITGTDGQVIGYVDVSRDVTAEQDQLDHQELLLQEIHHRVKNNLATVVSLLTLQMAGIEDPVAAEVLMQARGRIDAMLTVYESLNESESYRVIQLPRYLEDLCERLQETTRGSRISFRSQIEELAIENNDAVALGMIVNELVTNADKYAYPPGSTAGEAGVIRVELSQTEETSYTLSVGDRGVSLPENIYDEKTGTLQGTGLGLTVVQSLVDKLRASITVERDEGTCFRIVVPKKDVS